MNAVSTNVMPPDEIAQRVWPVLRQELTLHHGPRDTNGAPTWTLHDPVRNQYFSLDWIAFHVVSRLKLGRVDAIKISLQQTTPVHLEDQDIKFK